MVYEIFFPFLKGFHLTLAQHLPQRNEEGWKLSYLEWIGHLEHRIEEGRMTREEVKCLDNAEKTNVERLPDENVKLVPRFYSCLDALGKLMEQENPPVVVVRSQKCLLLIYGFANASGSGLRSTLLIQNKIHYRIGT